MSDERSTTAKDRRIGQRVRTRRLEIEMSQERLAELLGITFQQVQKYEKGVNRIASGRLHDISEALDYPVARFFEGLGKGSSKSAVAAEPQTPQESQLLVLFRKAGTKLQNRILGLVKALVDDK